MANFTKVPAHERFWKFVTPGLPDECWEWQGGKMGSGYGQFYIAKRHPIGAHRFSWMLANDMPEIPRGRQIIHSCDNRPCVNPAHLRIGTPSDNAWDKTIKGRNPGNRTARGGVPAKYTWQTIQALRDEGRTFVEIGALLGISNATAFRTLHRL